MINKNSEIHKDAKISKTTDIGPYVVIGPKVEIGDNVTIWGSENHRIESLSKEINKNPYTFLTGVTQRVKRKYINA